MSTIKKTKAKTVATTLKVPGPRRVRRDGRTIVGMDLEDDPKSDRIARQILNADSKRHLADSRTALWAIKKFKGLKAQDRLDTMTMMAYMWMLIQRVESTSHGHGKYYGECSYEIISGEDDWGSSGGPPGFDFYSERALKVHVAGETFVVNPGSASWVIDLVHEKIDEHEAKVQEQRDLEARRNKALDRARKKLTPEDLELLGLKC